MITSEKPKKVRYNIREARRRFGGNQGEFAHELGISPTYLSDLERGVYDPSSGLFARICQAAQCQPADLVYLDTAP